MKARERIIRILLYILERPKQCTLKHLAAHFKVNQSTIKDDIEFLENGGIEVLREKKGRAHVFSVEVNGEFAELQYLLPMSEGDIASIHHGLNYLTDKTKVHYLKRKLKTLHDFQKLGLNALRKPNLEKINRLEKAYSEKRQVILKGYRSNSNNIRDRVAEVFLITPEHDTIQAFDVVDKKVKHFKLSRIDLVEITPNAWSHGKQHERKSTDVFRIAMNGQQLVELQIDVYAYNSLIDNYPKAKADCQFYQQSNSFHFQSRVNPLFLGLTNFIMNNAGHVKIISPPELKKKVRQQIDILLEHLNSSDELG